MYLAKSFLTWKAWELITSSAFCEALCFFFLETLELGASIFTFFTFMFVYLLLVGHNRVQYIYITLNLLEEKDLSGMFTLLGWDMYPCEDNPTQQTSMSHMGWSTWYWVIKEDNGRFNWNGFERRDAYSSFPAFMSWWWMGRCSYGWFWSAKICHTTLLHICICTFKRPPYLALPRKEQQYK